MTPLQDSLELLFVAVPPLLQLSHELNESRLLSDPVEVWVARKEWIVRHAGIGGRSQPLDGFISLAVERIDACYVVSNMVIGASTRGCASSSRPFPMSAISGPTSPKKWRL